MSTPKRKWYDEDKDEAAHTLPANGLQQAMETRIANGGETHALPSEKPAAPLVQQPWRSPATEAALDSHLNASLIERLRAAGFSPELPLIGDTVYFLEGAKIHSAQVTDIYVSFFVKDGSPKTVADYRLAGTSRNYSRAGSLVYKTREALIENL